MRAAFLLFVFSLFACDGTFYRGEPLETPTPAPTATPSPTPTPDPSIRIELTWDIDYADADNHLVFVTGTASGGAFKSIPWDCHNANASPAWGASLDIDDTEGYGPENIKSDGLPDGTYRVYAHYYSDDGVGPTVARVRIYQGADLRWEGTHGLAGTGKVWVVGTLELPAFTFTADGTIFDWSP